MSTLLDPMLDADVLALGAGAVDQLFDTLQFRALRERLARDT